ncbi:heme exporter protein CcmD [Zavarzinia compransoris]|uniref:Heme exporter protein D n=1 Tax=Zavarzinia compransoris TaxID=1264899 RepID=A0A317E503_9PROT|nr:heme exporter protein CcmD [Zavarzinia compransoris]PWR22069.1 heme exporter protein CcmD [Zavarzinia compransoris]TDP47189.1 heme exporter protein D [Zavarzinia compransoris]
MDALLAFLAMGGYAAFVWPAFILTFAVVIGLAVGSWRSLKRAEARLALLEQARPPRRGRQRTAA